MGTHAPKASRRYPASWGGTSHSVVRSAVLPKADRDGYQVPTDGRESFWRAIARMLENFGDALDITEATLLAERVSKLEKEVAKLKEQRPT